ncbi:hypothetical protein AWB92_08915 [Mycobacterium sp. IEC1808]|nr:hypothetical protein AWB92_08915 [Mycobacterium sp. IEC1808]
MRAFSGFAATIKLSLANEMSRQVDWSSGAPGADEVGAVVGWDEAAVGELEVDVSLDVEAG